MPRGVSKSDINEKPTKKKKNKAKPKTTKKNARPDSGLPGEEQAMLQCIISFMQSHVRPHDVKFSEIRDHLRVKNLDHIKRQVKFLRRFPSLFEIDLPGCSVKFKGKMTGPVNSPPQNLEAITNLFPTCIKESSLNDRSSYGSPPCFVVVKPNEVQSALERLSGPSLLAVKCEGVNFNGVRELTLLELASGEHVFLFDFLAMDDHDLTYAISKLRPLLEDQAICKIFHDCRHDSAALWRQYKIKLASVFDTQATYASIKSHQKKNIPNLLPALQELLQIYHCKDWFPGFDRVRQMMVNNPMIWRSRPLTEELVIYATKAVLCLFTVRQALLEDLRKLVLKACINEGDRYASLFLSMTGETKMVDRAMAFNSKNELVEEVEIPNYERGAIVRTPLVIEEDLWSLIRLLPDSFAAHPMFCDSEVCSQLREISLDIGRDPIARFHSGKKLIMYEKVTREDIDSSVCKLGNFGTDKRAGVEGTLHRISAICNRSDEVIGLTFRFGRAVRGCADIIRDVVQCHTGGGILLLGYPGTGKTTIIRDIARVLSEEKNVVIIDTSNEIGGDGSIPHPAIGLARRMQVKKVDEQQERMIECVQNHTPDVIIIDEIGRAKEAHAARTIAQRGVRLVASAHGSFAELIHNPVLSELVGGVNIVTVGDRAAERLYDGSKNVQQRTQGSIFETVIELGKGNMHSWSIFRDVDKVVDKVLQGLPFRVEVRSVDPVSGQLRSREEIRTVPHTSPTSLLDCLQG